jgi:hypothetical protein
MAAHPNPDPIKNPDSPDPEAKAELPDQATLRQDSFRKVVLGQVSDPIFPPASSAPDVSEEELTRQAREDSGPRMRNRHHIPPLWRWLVLVILTSIALSIVLAR